MRCFPPPIKLSDNCSRWKMSSLEAYEALRAGKDYEPRTPENEIYLTDAQVAARYNVSRNSVWRWARESSGVAA